MQNNLFANETFSLKKWFYKQLSLIKFHKQYFLFAKKTFLIKNYYQQKKLSQQKNSFHEKKKFFV